MQHITALRHIVLLPFIWLLLYFMLSSIVLDTHNYKLFNNAAAMGQGSSPLRNIFDRFPFLESCRDFLQGVGRPRRRHSTKRYWRSPTLQSSSRPTNFRMYDISAIHNSYALPQERTNHPYRISDSIEKTRIKSPENVNHNEIGNPLYFPGTISRENSFVPKYHTYIPHSSKSSYSTRKDVKLTEGYKQRHTGARSKLGNSISTQQAIQTFPNIVNDDEFRRFAISHHTKNIITQTPTYQHDKPQINSGNNFTHNPIVYPNGIHEPPIWNSELKSLSGQQIKVGSLNPSKINTLGPVLSPGRSLTEIEDIHITQKLPNETELNDDILDDTLSDDDDDKDIRISSTLVSENQEIQRNSVLNVTVLSKDEEATINIDSVKEKTTTAPLFTDLQYNVEENIRVTPNKVKFNDPPSSVTQENTVFDLLKTLLNDTSFEYLLFKLQGNNNNNNTTLHQGASTTTPTTRTTTTTTTFPVTTLLTSNPFTLLKPKIQSTTEYNNRTMFLEKEKSPLTHLSDRAVFNLLLKQQQQILNSLATANNGLRNEHIPSSLHGSSMPAPSSHSVMPLSNPTSPIHGPKIEQAEIQIQKPCGNFYTPITSGQMLAAASLVELKCIFSKGKTPQKIPLGFMYGSLLRIVHTKAMSEYRPGLWGGRFIFNTKCKGGEPQIISGVINKQSLMYFSRLYIGKAPETPFAPLAQSEYIDKNPSLWFDYTTNFGAQCPGELTHRFHKNMPMSYAERPVRTSENSFGALYRRPELFEIPNESSYDFGINSDNIELLLDDETSPFAENQNVNTNYIQVEKDDDWNSDNTQTEHPYYKIRNLAKNYTRQLNQIPTLREFGKLTEQVDIGPALNAAQQGLVEFQNFVKSAASIASSFAQLRGGGSSSSGNNNLSNSALSAGYSNLNTKQNSPRLSYNGRGSSDISNDSTLQTEQRMRRIVIEEIKKYNPNINGNFMSSDSPINSLVDELRFIGHDLETGADLYLGRTLFPTTKNYRTLVWWLGQSFDLQHNEMYVHTL